MSYFIDFVQASGPKKVQSLADFKKNQNLLCTDFYKPIRDTMVEIHRKGLDPAPTLQALYAALENAKTAKIFPVVGAGYLKWLEQAKPERSFKPASAALPAGPGLSIAVNPELGLVINGERHHIKLYMRSKDPISRERIDLSIALMGAALEVPRDHKLAVLDVPCSKLHYLSPKSSEPRAFQKLQILIACEAAAYATGWGRV